MGLGLALDTALSGLRYNGIGISLTSGNVANAGNLDYTKKRVSAVATSVNDEGAGVTASAITRQLDVFVQKSLRTETSAAGYATARSDMLSRLDMAYGVPGSVGAFDTAFNNFSTALQSLGTTPDSYIARNQVITTASSLVDRLGTMSRMVQSLRSDAETALGDTVKEANSLLEQLEKINATIRGTPTGTAAYATFLDQRDATVQKLTGLMDINVTEQRDNSVTISTVQGTVLLGTTRTGLIFDARGDLSPYDSYNTDPAKRSVGTITTSTGVDLIANGAFRSGKIKALVEMRDQTLVMAQSQLDEIAGKMASALGTNKVSAPVGTASGGVPYGADLNLGTDGNGGTGLLDGNTITMTLESNGVKQNFTFKRVDDAGVTVNNAMTADPNDIVVRLSGNTAAGYVTQMNTAIAAWAGGNAAAFTVTASGNTLQVRANPAANAGAQAISANLSAQSLQSGAAALPMFTDNGAVNGLFTDSYRVGVQQSLGLSQRLSVNGALKADLNKLVQMAANTFQGDTTRPNFMFDQLNTTQISFNPKTGIGGVTAPYTGTVMGFMRQTVTNQTNMAATAKNVSTGQDQIVKSLMARFQEKSTVNMDEEMANLITLQQAYGANARVMTVAKEMIDTLMRA